MLRRPSAQRSAARPPPDSAHAVNQDMAGAARSRRAGAAAPALAMGGACGLAWAAGLRGFMAELAGSGSSVGWYGTFAQILLPGVIAGLLLGWAEHIRRNGGRRGWRWLAVAPIVFTVAVFVSPEVFRAVLNGQPLFAGGIGGGAIALPLFGMAGGYAISGRGPIWSRILFGVVAALPAPGWASAASLFGSGFALTTPRGAWIALYFYAFVATLSLASAIPHRPVVRVMTIAAGRVVEGAAGPSGGGSSIRCAGDGPDAATNRADGGRDHVL